MAFTSDWIIGDIQKGKNTSASGSAVFSKTNTTITRYRYSDEPFYSEEGTFQKSISAKNGGITYAETSPVINGLHFATTTNWVNKDAVWVMSGSSFNGFPVYVQAAGFSNLPLSNKVNAIFLVESRSNSSQYYFWSKTLYCAELSADQIIAGDFRLGANYATGPLTNTQWLIEAIAPSQLAPPSHLGTYTGTGTFSGASVFTDGFSASGYFFCESDQQVFDTRGAYWYKQVQTWRASGEWR